MVTSSLNHDDIVIEDIVKSYGYGDSNHRVLHNINLTLHGGEFVSLIGPSGCGKSTLLKVVAGLVTPDSGSVTIGGYALESAAKDKRIGFVPQAPALLPWKTVLKNVELPMKVNRGANGNRSMQDPAELLKSFNLGHALNKYPSQLSGGMQQRVAIARAFAFDPSVLLMDEPFSALDELNRDQQRLGLMDFWQSNRKTVLFVTHSVPEAIILSDRIVVLSANPGQVSEIIEVDLPRPRNEALYASDAFRDLEARTRDALHSVMKEAA